MVKNGPCHHCGVTSTPLWRNGPPDKPILCNACGSRWRTKGTLMNYTPLHARDSYEIEEPKHTNERKLSVKFKDKLSSAKWIDSNVGDEPANEGYTRFCRKVVDEEMSNHSSSGSAVSYAESCAHFSGSEICDVSGSLQSNVWESVVPSRRRTDITRKPSSERKLTKDFPSYKRPSSVEKLTRDLHSILHQETSCFVSPEDHLLYENSTPMGCLEIGHGGMLIKHLNSMSTQQESEVSSLSEEKKVVCAALPVPIHTGRLSFENICDKNVKKTQETVEQPRRVKFCQEKFNILQDRNSVLGSVNLKGIVSFEGFTELLTTEEQQKLKNFLPSIDVSELPESLKCLFINPQILEAFSFFQHLLREGIFDLTSTQMKTEDCKHLKRLALSNLEKTRLVETYYELIKEAKDGQPSGEDRIDSRMGVTCCSTTSHLKRPRESSVSIPNGFPDAKAIARSPRRSCITCSQDQLPIRNLQQDLNIAAGSPNSEARGDANPRSPFVSPFSRDGIIISLPFSDASLDQELLVDVRSNSSFPEAELLSESWALKTTANSFYTPCGVSEKEGSLSCHSAVVFGNNQPDIDS